MVPLQRLFRQILGLTRQILKSPPEWARLADVRRARGATRATRDGARGAPRPLGRPWGGDRPRARDGRRARRAHTGDRRGRERLARRRGRHLAPYAIHSRCRTVPPEVRVWRERRSRRTEHRDGASTTANNELRFSSFRASDDGDGSGRIPLSSFCECRGCQKRISLKLLRKAVVATWRKIPRWRALHARRIPRHTSLRRRESLVAYLHTN